MTWIRQAVFKAESQCCYEGNAMLTGGPLKFPRATVTRKYRERPIDDITDWADREARERIWMQADKACKELSGKFYACAIEIRVILTSEVLVVEKIEKKVVPEVIPEAIKVKPEIIEEVKVPEIVIKVPEFVLRTISDLERRRDAAKTKDRKERIQKIINELKKEYGIKIE